MGLCAGGGSSEQLLIVQTLSLAVEAAPWQVELGRGFYILSMLLCARFFDLSFPRLSSLDAVLHKYQRCGFLALVGMFFICLSVPLCARLFELSASRLISLDPMLHPYQRHGFLALSGI